jgi:LytR cell envelope-related transcriptional attenuator
MDLIEQIGAFLGLVAFLGLAVLVLLYFQQARDVRRLREWAGRAPERAEAAAADATAAAAEEAGVEPEEVAAAPGGSFGERVRARVPVPTAMRGRLPAPRYLAAIAAVVVIVAAGVVTGGFGLTGDDGGKKRKDGGGGGSTPKPADVEVAVLNGTGVAGAPGIPGLADTVAKEVKSDGYKVVAVADAQTSFAESVIMFQSDDKTAAEQLADDLKKLLGKTKLQQMADDIRSLAKGAPVAVVIGPDDSQIG